jgi:hypothetical protein
MRSSFASWLLGYGKTQGREDFSRDSLSPLVVRLVGLLVAIAVRPRVAALRRGLKDQQHPPSLLLVGQGRELQASLGARVGTDSRGENLVRPVKGIIVGLATKQQACDCFSRGLAEHLLARLSVSALEQ